MPAETPISSAENTALIDTVKQVEMSGLTVKEWSVMALQQNNCANHRQAWQRHKKRLSFEQAWIDTIQTIQPWGLNAIE